MVLMIVYLLVFWCLGRADKITSWHTERFSTHVSPLSEFPLQCLGQATQQLYQQAKTQTLLNERDAWGAPQSHRNH